MAEYNYAKIIGKRIKNARESAGMTQVRLHELTGLSITQISAYENGNRNIGLESLNKIAKATNSTIDELYNGKTEDKPILHSTNKGKLIINCFLSLFENGIIKVIHKQKNKSYSNSQYDLVQELSVVEFSDILEDFILKLEDFEENKNNYPNPLDFKYQIIEASSKKINDRIETKKQKSLHLNS